jgi:hypothetical protein
MVHVAHYLLFYIVTRQIYFLLKFHLSGTIKELNVHLTIILLDEIEQDRQNIIHTEVNVICWDGQHWFKRE